MNSFELKDKEKRITCERDRSVNPAMHHRIVTRSLYFGKTNGASLIVAESAVCAANSPGMAVQGSLNGPNGAAAALVNGVLTTMTLGMKSPVSGFVTYTKHKNANIITGQREVKGGWGGGVNVSIVGDQGGKQVAGILQAWEPLV
ncbi:TIGR04388 family protein [Leptospira sp. WS92.C1]